jgi:hypothetical protein
MLKKYLVGQLPAGEGRRGGAGAASGSTSAAGSGANAASHGGSIFYYVLPVAVLAIALWWQFARQGEAPASK